MKVSDEFREQAVLIAIDHCLRTIQQLPSEHDHRQAVADAVVADVLMVADAVCRAMERPATEPATGDGVHNERNRCVAILKAAKIKTHRKAQYEAMAAIRECLDAVKSGQPCDEVKK